MTLGSNNIWNIYNFI